ncbi:MAG: chorismate synthase [Eggerthellaceae bacterium]|nr:chorismate synthase [Eggerthellaceae bacterium]
MASFVGNALHIQIFGQSHSPALGVTIDGLPTGEHIDMQKLQAFAGRRAPGGAVWSTPRSEKDAIEVLSGLVDDTTCGAPFAAIIRNTNTRSGDYDNLHKIPRPGHADYVAHVKYHGFQDVSGGGHFSGRLTASLVIAGGIAMQILERRGIYVGAHIAQIGDIYDTPFSLQNIGHDVLVSAGNKEFPVLDDAQGEHMISLISEVRKAHDSIGGVVECALIGAPIGWGEPMFQGIENTLAQMLFGIPAVKGVEFGRGFQAAAMRGSQHNDAYRMDGENVTFETNNAGGILGGITTGEPIVFRVAFKPTSSIGMAQASVDITSNKDAALEVKGRHDPCVAVRAVPVVEAVGALALLDAGLAAGGIHNAQQ